MIESVKITSLNNIGSNLSYSSIFPVVDVSGTPITDKANLQIIGNYILSQAGGANMVQAAQATLAQAVVNSAQPNITSVGTLSINTLHISGGTNGQYLQTDGTGNLNWVSGGGSGNGTVGGATGQIQFNNAGHFGGSTNLTWDQANALLGATNFVASHATIYGNVDSVNLNASGNVRTGAIYTDHYYYANGYVFGGGGGGTPGGVSTQVQFNDAGAFAGNTGFTFNKTTGVLNVTHLSGEGGNLSNIQGSNVSGTVAYAAVANSVAGANVSGQVSHAAAANSVAVANVVGLGNIATVALDGSSSHVLYGNGQWAAASSANVGNFAFDSTDVDGTTYDEIVLTGTNSGNILVNADNLVMISGSYESDGLIAGGGNVYLFNGDPTYANGIPQPGVGHIWQFDDTGNTTLPTGAAIANISGFGPGLSTFFGDANGATFGTGPGNDITFTPADGAAIYSNGFMWTFSTDGNLTTPGNITGANVIEANTFLGTGNLKLQPDPNNNGAYLDVYLTSGPDVHIAGNGETVIVGSDAGANVSVQASGNVAIQANAVFGGTPRTWMFDYNGNLTLPQLTTINDVSGTGTTLTVGVPPTVIVISGADFVAVNTTYTRDFGQATPTWYPAGYTPGVNPYIMFTGGQYGIYNPGFVPPLYINTGTLNIPLIQWNLNPPLGSIAPTAVYTYGSTGPAWKFDPTGNLKLPGVLVAQASDNGSIIFSNNGTDTNGSFKVDGGLNMTISANSNFYVKRAGSDRLAITDTDTTLMAGANLVLKSNKNATEKVWTFDTTGNLTAPGNITSGNLLTRTLYTGGATTVPSGVTMDGGVVVNGNIATVLTASYQGNGFFAINANTSVAGAGDLFDRSINGGWSRNLTLANGNVQIANYIVFNDGSYQNTAPIIYNNSNVATFLASFGSNTITTTGNIKAGNANVTGNLVLASTTNIVSVSGSNGNITLDPDGTGVVNVIGNVVANNFSGNISITGNVQGTSPNVTLVAGSYSATFDNTGVLTLPAQGIGPSNEGAEIDFTKAPNSSLSGNAVIVDQYIDRIRFFEGGGSARGAYIDLSQAAAGVNTLLNNRVSGLVNAGTFVTMDNLKATVTTSGQRGLSLAAVSGSFNILIGSSYSLTASTGGNSGGGTVNTTPSTSQFGYNFTGAGDTSTYIITDTTNNRAYRITLQIGASYNNNLITIERLV